MYKLKNSFNYKGNILEPGTTLPTNIPEVVIKNMIAEGNVEEFNPSENSETSESEIQPETTNSDSDTEGKADDTEDKDVSGSGKK